MSALPADPYVPRRPLHPHGWYNAGLPAATPVASDSAAAIAELQAQIASPGGFVNTTNFSVPQYICPPGQARVPVTLVDNTNTPFTQRQNDPNDAIALAWELAHTGVPIPPNAAPSAGTDSSISLWSPSTDEWWDFWKFTVSAGPVYKAQWGGYMRDVHRNPGRYETPFPSWGSSATSLAGTIAGMITADDLRSGRINHALILSVVNANPTSQYPAQRGDGQTGGNAIHEGDLLRLPAGFDLTTVSGPNATATRFLRMLAAAARDYGFIISDKGGNVCVVIEDRDLQASYVSYIAGGAAYGTMMAAFPWSSLQKVDVAGGYRPKALNPRADGTAPTFVASSSLAGQARTTASLAPPAGTKAGDIEILAVALYKQPTTIAVAGWNRLLPPHGNNATDGVQFALFWRRADLTSQDTAAITWDGSSNYVAALMGVYRGAIPLSSPFDTASYLDRGFVSGSPNDVGLFSTLPNELLVQIVYGSGSLTVNPLGGQSARASTNKLALLDAPQAPGVCQLGFDTGATSQWTINAGIVLKPALPLRGARR